MYRIASGHGRLSSEHLLCCEYLRWPGWGRLSLDSFYRGRQKSVFDLILQEAFSNNSYRLFWKTSCTLPCYCHVSVSCSSMISWLRMISNGFHFFSKGQCSMTGTSNLIELSGITNPHALTVSAELWTWAVSHIIPWVRVMVRAGVTCPTTAVSSISQIAATLSRLLTLVLTLLQLEPKGWPNPQAYA